MKGTITPLVSALLFTFVSGVARAEDPKPSLADKRLDLSVPDIPAFTALGVSPSTISRPDNVKDLAAAIASGIGADGSIQSGVAIEVSPVKLLANAAPDTSFPHEALGGLRFSGATNATSDSQGSHTYLAGGARYSYGGYHPEADEDLKNCLTQQMKLPEVPQTPPASETVAGPGGAPPPTNGNVQADAWTISKIPNLTKCRALFRAAHLAEWSIEVAGVHTESALASAKLSDFHPDTNSGWIAGTLPVYRSFKDDFKPAKPEDWRSKVDDKDLQARAARAFAFAPILFARVDSKRLTPAASTERQTDVYLAARQPFLSDGWSLFAEGGYKWNDVSGTLPTAPKNAAPLGFGGDMRLGNGTWLGIFVGADAITGTLLSLGNLKWALGETRPY